MLPMNSSLNGAVFELVGDCHTGISVAGRNLRLVFGDMAALQDESADGKQEQEDKRELEFGAAELADHASTISRLRVRPGSSSVR
jgi:hypothetical protein